MRYIALLRGINVGGNTMIKMDDLKAEFRTLGFENVTSYINSGNIAFDVAKSDESKLVQKLETAIEERFGRAVAVMVREQQEIARIIESNPFAGSFESHKEMHVLFLKEDLPTEKAGQLTSSALPGERYEVRGREIYAHLPQGVANSLLTKGFFEKKPRVSATARNWRTVQKLAVL
jgi:uncharacterized protein (DUF1697 family)